MGHQDKEMDVESLQKSGRKRGGCLEAFLVTSIILLFVAVVALAVGGTIFVMKLESQLQSPRPSIHLGPSKLTGDSPDPAYKMNKFVYLDAIPSDLKNFTMRWASVSYGSGKSVGSNFDFDEAQSSLRPKQEGTYFMYMDLNLTCTYKCPAGVFSVHVGNKMTCKVQLPALNDSTPVTKKCWTVSQMQGDRLLTQMIVPENGLEYWKLEPLGSGFGMFLVD